MLARRCKSLRCPQKSESLVCASLTEIPALCTVLLTSRLPNFRVVVMTKLTKAAIEGTTAGLDANGFLVVRKDDGTDTLIVAGGVRAAGS